MLNCSIGVLLIVLLILIVYKISIANEIKSYNDGICSKCGSKLILYKKNKKDFGKESVYECPKCGNTIILYWYDPDEDEEED